MTATAQDQWLAANTIKCPVGRVSKRECALLRARPTITEAVSHHGGKPGEKERFARPGACDNCPGWDFQREHPYEKQQAEREKARQPKSLSRPDTTEDIMPDNTAEVKPKTKHCNNCNRTLPVTEFYETMSNRSGFRGQCKDCERARARKNAADRKARKAAQKTGSQSTVPGSQSTDNRKPASSPSYARIPTPPLRPYPEGQDEAFTKILSLLRDFRAEAYEQGIKTGHRMAMEKTRSALGEEAAL